MSAGRRKEERERERDYESRILIGLNYARRRARFNTAKVFHDAPTHGFVLSPLSPSFMDPRLMQEYTAGFKGSYVARNENGPLTSFAIVVYRIFSSSVRSFECRIRETRLSRHAVSIRFPSQIPRSALHRLTTATMISSLRLVDHRNISSFPRKILISHGIQSPSRSVNIYFEKISVARTVI